MMFKKLLFFGLILFAILMQPSFAQNDQSDYPLMRPGNTCASSATTRLYEVKLFFRDACDRLPATTNAT
jgi:hypothetical protein